MEGADPLRALRERIVELIAWFSDDAARLPAAQGSWRLDELWDARVDAEVERWQIALAEARPLPLDAGDHAERRLFELECLDLLAWLAAGAARQAPAQRVQLRDRAHFLIRLARERTPHTARQAGLIYTHLRYHALVPAEIECGDAVRSYRVRVEHMAHGARRCDDARARGQIAVATTSFGDGAALELIDCTAVTVATAKERAAKLSQAIATASARGVDILVLPELTVPPAERAAVLEKLRWGSGGAELALLVPGSFHEQLAGGTYNRAILVDGKGNQLAEHRKLTMYGKLDGWLESITLGAVITVLVTPIGTVAIAICKDFCDDHVGRVWQQLQPEWLLVPAYGPGAKAHEAAAARIARMVGTITVLAHEGDLVLEAPQNSFVHGAKIAHGNAVAPAYFEHNMLFSFKGIVRTE